MQYSNSEIYGDYCVYFTELVGSGSYGKVYGAKQISTNQLICVKIIRITNENEKLLEREIIILKKLIEFDNPHLIKIYDISKQNNQLLIFMERCQQTLGDYITKNKQQKQLLSLFEIIDLAKQIINGYRDLYSHNIIHRDLKPENLLIGTDDKIKICDFGFGKILNFDNQFFLQTIIGTPLYVSPQALMTGQYSSKTDVYSFGLLIYYLIFQESYYKVQTLDQLFQKIIVLDKEFLIGEFKNQGNEQDSALLNYILHGCIKYHEKDRFDWEQLFQIFDQITILKPRPQSKRLIDQRQNSNSQSKLINLQQDEQLQQIQQDQQNKINQNLNQKPPLKQNPENRNQFRISNYKQSFEYQSSRERQNKSQENNQTKTRDTSNENIILRISQTPERTNNARQINYSTQCRSRKYRINSSKEKDNKTKNNGYIIKLQQQKQLIKQNESEKDYLLNKEENEIELNNNNKQQQYVKTYQIKQNNQSQKKLIKSPSLNQNIQKLQNNYFKQHLCNQDNDVIQSLKEDTTQQQNYQTKIIMLQQILKGIFAKVQLAENLSSSSSNLIQILDHRLSLFRFLIINYQQSLLENINSIYNNEKNLLLYPLQNQLIEFIDPINLILDERIKKKMSNLTQILQKLQLKNQMALKYINNILKEKEKYNVEDIVILIQTNAIKYNYGSILESYQNHYNKFLEQHQYDLSQIKSGDLLKFLGYSTKFILSESLYSIDKLKSINIEEIPNLSDNSLILEQFIKENCKKNLKF
ncbi:unnamed protein product [Paramecium pentaurelia]|uniref:Protein kinase domain-containing protein n=1 Tax=Paramecium pentaurelia TaxID=43138 RepID=A0A8S1UFJ8_9CILI|nr:unnamed protein product [Paramecium pentaurelia]